jgi:CHAD domain-containing protein
VAYRLDPTAPLDDEVRRVAGELLEDAVHRLRERSPSTDDIHKSRTDLKKFRSLVRLVTLADSGKGSPGRVARDAGRRLSAQRDQVVMTKTFESLVPELAGLVGPQTVLRVRAGLASAAAAMRRSSVGPQAVEREVADDLDALALSTALWELEDDGFAGIEGRLRKRYELGRHALAALGPDPHPEELHELRKGVKDHWYHLRLLRDAWPPVLSTLADEAKVLAEQLGDDHDLSVLATALGGDGSDLLGEDRAAVLGLITDRRVALLVEICSGAARVYADTPKAFTRRLGRWWQEAERRYP